MGGGLARGMYLLILILVTLTIQLSPLTYSPGSAQSTHHLGGEGESRGIHANTLTIQLSPLTYSPGTAQSTHHFVSLSYRNSADGKSGTFLSKFRTPFDRDISISPTKLFKKKS